MRKLSGSLFALAVLVSASCGGPTIQQQLLQLSPVATTVAPGQSVSLKVTAPTDPNGYAILTLTPYGQGTLSPSFVRMGQSVTYTAPTVPLPNQTVLITATTQDQVINATTTAVIEINGSNGLLNLAISAPTGNMTPVMGWAVDAGDVWIDGGLKPDASIPPGATLASVSLINSTGTSQYFYTSELLSLPAGVYTLDAGFGEIFDPIASTLYYPTVASNKVTVVPGTMTTASVLYVNPKETSGRVWLPFCGAANGTNWWSQVGNFFNLDYQNPPNLVSYTSAELRNPLTVENGGTPATNMALFVPGSSGNNCMQGMAFDPAGNIWVADADDGQLVAFVEPGGPKVQVSTQPMIALRITQGSAGLSSFRPTAVAFAPNGDLWALDWANDNSARIIRFPWAPIQAALVAGSLDGGDPWGTDNNVHFADISIAPTGIVDSAVVGSTYSLDNPFDMAFDKQGNLWVANYGNNVLARWTNPSSTTSGVTGEKAYLPSAVLVSDGGFNGPSGLAFDPAGNLWVTNNLGGNVARLSGAALNLLPVNNPSPVAAPITTTLNGGLAGFKDIRNLAFDQTGNLWLAMGDNNGTQGSNNANGFLYEIQNPSQYADAGWNVTPYGSINSLSLTNLPFGSTGLPATTHFQFDPPPAGVPLNW
jgi:sugar lactone lactonase YvrE